MKENVSGCFFLNAVNIQIEAAVADCKRMIWWWS